MNDKQQIPVSSPLMLDGWLEFNRVKWSLKPLKLRLSEKDSDLPAIEAVVYLDKKGRITQPPLNPYLPLCFFPSPTEKVARLYRQWLNVSGILADVFKNRRVRSAVILPPEAKDVRQWQWRGFLAEVRYTFCLDFPFNEDNIDYQVQKQIKKAENTGYLCEHVDENKNNLEEVVHCLADTETRQNFSYGVIVSDLRLALQLLGEEHFRIYICRTPSGEVASVRIILARANSCAIDWIAGTRRRFLMSGATQQLIYFALKDLENNKVSSLDYCGANLPSVSMAKANWGGRLLPYYSISAPNIRSLFRFGCLIRKYSKWQQP